MIVVKSGKEKSGVQWRRNSFVGTAQWILNVLSSIDAKHLAEDELISLEIIKTELKTFQKRLQINKGSVIKIVEKK